MRRWIRYIIHQSLFSSFLYKVVYRKWLQRFRKQEGFLSGEAIKNYLDASFRYQYHPEENVNFKRPISNGDPLPKQISFYVGRSFKVSAGEIYLFENAFLMGENAVGVTHDGKIILDTAMDLPNVLHKSNPRLLMKYKNVNVDMSVDTAISLVHIFCNSHYVNYFHWVCDSLLLLEGLEAAKKRFNRSIKVIVNDNLKPFQKEYMKLLGLKEDDLIYWKDYRKMQLQCLVVVKSRRTGTNMDEIVSPNGVNWLRKKLINKVHLKPLFGDRVYLTRQHTECRRIVNFDKIAPILEKHQFSVINPDELNISEQVNLFANMKVLCAPHGAGLTNIVFSKSLKIIEFIGNVDTPDDFQWYCAYYSMSQALGQQYSFLIGETIPLLSGKRTKQIYDLKIDPLKLEQLLLDVIDGVEE